MRKFTRKQRIILGILPLVCCLWPIFLYKAAEHNVLTHTESIFSILYTVVSLLLLPLPALILCIYFAVKKRWFVFWMCLMISVSLIVGGFVITIPECPTCRTIREFY